MSFRFPYLAIDIETTGLDTFKSQVLQLAAVYDAGGPMKSLPTFNIVIHHPVITYAEAFCLKLNRHLLEKSPNDPDVYTLEDARNQFRMWSFGTRGLYGPGNGALTLAGKNIASFDVPVLSNSVNGFKMGGFNRRVLDIGSMFVEDFDHIPSLDEVNKLIGREKVSHDALQDAWDVVHAVRHKWGVL